MIGNPHEEASQDEFREAILSAIGIKALQFLADLGIDMREVDQPRKQQGEYHEFEFDAFGRTVRFYETDFPRNFIRCVNDAEQNKQTNEQSVHGVYISFAFTHSVGKAYSGTETLPTLHPQTLAFLRFIKYFSELVEQDLILVPADLRRSEMYESTLKRITGKNVWVMNLGEM